MIITSHRHQSWLAAMRRCKRSRPSCRVPDSSTRLWFVLLLFGDCEFHSTCQYRKFMRARVSVQFVGDTRCASLACRMCRLFATLGTDMPTTSPMSLQNLLLFLRRMVVRSCMSLRPSFPPSLPPSVRPSITFLSFRSFLPCIFLPFTYLINNPVHRSNAILTYSSKAQRQPQIGFFSVCSVCWECVCACVCVSFFCFVLMCSWVFFVLCCRAATNTSSSRDRSTSVVCGCDRASSSACCHRGRRDDRHHPDVLVRVAVCSCVALLLLVAVCRVRVLACCTRRGQHFACWHPLVCVAILAHLTSPSPPTSLPPLLRVFGLLLSPPFATGPPSCSAAPTFAILPSFCCH